jgi:methyl-accepting chemotaxis protein
MTETETPDIRQALQAGSDIIAVMLKTGMNDTSGSMFLRDYLRTLSSGQGIYHKQQEVMESFAAESRQIDDETQQVLSLYQKNKIKMDAMETYFNSFIEELVLLQKIHEKLNEESESLRTLIKQVSAQIAAIQDISEQTNLLSFNASIEAARAGEAGKGFRIIANEVKRLSDTTRGNSQTINTDIAQLQKALASLLTENAGSTQIIEKLKKTAESSKDTLKTIAEDNTTSVQTTEHVVNRIASNNQKVIDVSALVEKENITQVQQIADHATENTIQLNDQVSLMLELKELFTYLKEKQQTQTP